jgi:hypothetical protein
MPAPSRPTTVQDMHARFEHFSTPEGRALGLAYRPTPDEVFIVTPAKCGTTWMQQIVHGLRSRGSMDFDEVSRVVPWIDMAHDLGIDIHAPQPAAPRAFKTHSPLDAVPAGGRYIVVVRDPADALVSNYHFAESMFFEKGSISLDTYAMESYLPSRSVVKHVLAMWPRHGDPDVLALCYEHIVADLPGTIERVAAFIGVPLDAELKAIVTRQSGIAFMQEHKEQFEDHIVRHARSGPMGLPADGRLDKVREGRVGSAEGRVAADVLGALQSQWSAEVTPATGLATYADLQRALRPPTV